MDPVGCDQYATLRVRVRLRGATAATTQGPATVSVQTVPSRLHGTDAELSMLTEDTVSAPMSTSTTTTEGWCR